MNLEKKVDKIEEAILMMKDLVLRHEERLDQHNQKLDDFYKAMDESREDFEFKLNALIDAQMRNENDIRELKDTSRELKDASQFQLKRIEILENK